MEAIRTVRFTAVISILLTGLGGAREVRVQEGPLYRVLDNPISILCNVSGYEGPPTQNHSSGSCTGPAPRTSPSPSPAPRTPPTSPTPSSPPASAKGDIFIRRLSGDSTELHLQQVRRRGRGRLRVLPHPHH
ncbi:unnamed protein product [Staurois parvus]|uniref:Uncharacterized protein n=1 Tax=Staurois parvus TaxID=386267 RepID=A0ABN9HI24_9NEOB|nr:unnamed protein product [Staurois parvus]